MERRGPWVRQSTDLLLERRFFAVHADRVTTPAGTSGSYDWIRAPDLVRVAALTSENGLLIVEQHHYLPDVLMWQLPGGTVDSGEHPADAAARELREEIGAHVQRWTNVGSVWPMPGLTNARTHLWLAEDLTIADASPEESEADLTVLLVPLDKAVGAALDGTISCATSAQLVLAVWATIQRGKGA